MKELYFRSEKKLIPVILVLNIMQVNKSLKLTYSDWFTIKFLIPNSAI